MQVPRWGGGVKDARCPQRTWFCLERMADIRLRLALSMSPASGAIPQKPNPGVSGGGWGSEKCGEGGQEQPVRSHQRHRGELQGWGETKRHQGQGVGLWGWETLL